MIIVVFPQPVGPTIATRLPCATDSEKCSMSGRSGTYEKQTSSMSIAPSGFGSAGREASDDCSSASKSANTRSAAADAV
ncbi:MAG: hypothetical protein ACLUSP_02485 [Christensenellales bacterium]